VLHSFQSQRRSKEKSSVDTLDIVFQSKIHGALETNHHYIFLSKDREQSFSLPNSQKIQNPHQMKLHKNSLENLFVNHQSQLNLRAHQAKNSSHHVDDLMDLSF
jgi:hypothetical protein